MVPTALGADDGDADLLYDPATGNVFIDADGATILSFGLESNGAFLTNFDQDQLNDDTFNADGLEDNTTNVIGWVSALATGNQGYTGANHDPAFIGNILQAGLDLQQVESILSEATWAGPQGAGGDFEIGLTAAAIPEPGSFIVLGLGALAILAQRRR